KRKPRRLEPGLRSFLVQMYEPLRVLERQGPQQHSVDDAEHRGVRADAQAERDDGYNRKAALPQQHSRAVAQVLPKGLHSSSQEVHPQSHTKKREGHSASSRPSLGFVGEIHSQRSAIIGSPFVARRAGTQHASIATKASSKAMPANVTGSVALTSNRNFLINRASANAAINPSDKPSATSR